MSPLRLGALLRPSLASLYACSTTHSKLVQSERRGFRCPQGLRFQECQGWLEEPGLISGAVQPTEVIQILGAANADEVNGRISGPRSLPTYKVRRNFYTFHRIFSQVPVQRQKVRHKLYTFHCVFNQCQCKGTRSAANSRRFFNPVPVQRYKVRRKSYKFHRVFNPVPVQRHKVRRKFYTFHQIFSQRSVFCQVPVQDQVQGQHVASPLLLSDRAEVAGQAFPGGWSNWRVSALWNGPEAERLILTPSHGDGHFTLPVWPPPEREQLPGMLRYLLAIGPQRILSCLGVNQDLVRRSSWMSL